MLSGVQLEKAMTPNLTNLTDKKKPGAVGFFSAYYKFNINFSPSAEPCMNQSQRENLSDFFVYVASIIQYQGDK